MIDPTGEAGCSVYICGSVTTHSDGSVTVRSSPILRSVVPGQVAWDNARTSHANGDTVGAVAGTAAMVGEQVLTVATLGAGTAATQTTRAATTQATTTASPLVSQKTANTANHIFGSKSLAKHNLGGFLGKFKGDQVKALDSLSSATQKLADKGKISGQFETSVKVKGFDVTVRGKVIDDKVNVSTAFIP